MAWEFSSDEISMRKGATAPSYGEVLRAVELLFPAEDSGDISVPF